MREKWPQIYLTAVITLFPKQTQKLESPFADLSDEEIAQFELQAEQGSCLRSSPYRKARRHRSARSPDIAAVFHRVLAVRYAEVPAMSNRDA